MTIHSLSRKAERDPAQTGGEKQPPIIPLGNCTVIFPDTIILSQVKQLILFLKLIYGIQVLALHNQGKTKKQFTSRGKVFVSSFAPPPPLHLHNFNPSNDKPPLLPCILHFTTHSFNHGAISSAYGHSQFSMQVLHLLIPIFNQPTTFKGSAFFYMMLFSSHCSALAIKLVL